MLTLDDYFGRFSLAAGEEPTEDVKANAVELLNRVNALLERITSDAGLAEAASPVVNSGWRSAAYNLTIPNAAPKSKHITGQAIDLADPEGELDQYLMDYRTLLMDYGLWLEHPLATKGWTHLQSVAPRSGNRVFYP